jgi:hypothetical protein
VPGLRAGVFGESGSIEFTENPGDAPALTEFDSSNDFRDTVPVDIAGMDREVAAV